MHPDLLSVRKPDEKSEIPVALLIGPKENRGKEGLLHDISLRPMAGGMRIALVDDAEYLNEEGANAILKTLEEPPPKSLLILLAPSADALLPTIRSRCQVLRFAPLAESDVAELLLEHGLTEDAKEAAEVSAIAQGSVETATELLDPKLRADRKSLYDGLAAKPFRAAQLAARLNSSIDDIGSERPPKLRHARWLVHFCVEFFRQALRELSAPQNSAGVVPQVAALVSRLQPATEETLDQLADAVDRCVTAQLQLGGNITIPLCLENLFDDLGKGLRS
jgi:DNA polymerase-3 subunit delta'